MKLPSMKMPVFVDGNRKMGMPSMKMAVFVDGNGKMSLPSMKMAVFVDGSSGYLLYLRDVLRFLEMAMKI